MKKNKHRFAVMHFFLACMSIAGLATAQPAISTISPGIGYPGSSINITGAGFNTSASGNIVYFGATKATVTTASSSSLTVTVPAGATYQPVSILNTSSQLTGYSRYPFLPSFDNSADIPGTVNVGPQVTFAAGGTPYGITIGDLDGDGMAEVAMVNLSSNTVSIYRNTSAPGSIVAGSFASKVDLPTGLEPSGVAIGDLDGDGKPELVVTNKNSDSVSVYRNISTSGSIVSGSFSTRINFSTGASPRSVLIRDMDGDGRPDLIISNRDGSSVSVLRNLGIAGPVASGFFAAKVDFSAELGACHVAMGDLNGDGKPDLAVSNFETANVSVLLNTSVPGSISAATKVNFSTGTNPAGVAIGDLNGDGRPDLAVACAGNDNVSVFRNTGTAGSLAFAARADFSTGGSPRSLAMGDMDGDGNVDIATANFDDNNVTILRNTTALGAATTSFAAKTDFGTGANAHNLAIGDLDGDGRADIAVANYGGTVLSVLRNNAILPISGTGAICAGSSLTLANVTAAGTWSSGSTAIATVGSSTGIVTGVATGTATISYNRPGGYTTTIVTVNLSPVAIAGTATVCPTSTTTLSNAVSGGNWSSGNLAEASVDSTTGIITGIAPGIAVITYALTSNGCSVTKNVTINPLPDAGTVAGPSSACAGSAVTLTKTATGGSWSSSNTAVATVGTTGVVSTIAAGVVDIRYIVINSCGQDTAVKNVAVYQSPAVIAGTFTVCLGATTTLSNSVSGGTWSSGNLAIAAIDSLSGIVTAGASPGTTAITYKLAGSGCSTTKNLTVASLTIDAGTISGPSAVCVNSNITLTKTVNGGAWSSVNNAIGTVNSSTGSVRGIAAGTVNIRYVVNNGCVSDTAIKTITVNPLPPAITGSSLACEGATTTLNNAVSGGTWSSDDLVSATVDSVTGVVTGMAAGNAVITYKLTSTGCIATKTLTVGILPSAGVLSGAAAVCTNSNIFLSSTVSGGTWSSSNTAIGTVGSTSGSVRGIASGTVEIRYAVGNSCGIDTATKVITVSTSVSNSISGPSSVCQGATIALTNLTSGKPWTSNDPAIATINSAGIVTGIAAGTTIITYGCDRTKSVTVNPLPDAGTISGASAVCDGSSTSLTSTVTGGTWSSSSTTIASVSSSGSVFGQSPGTAEIRYRVTNSFCADTAKHNVTVSNPPASITGTATVCQGATTTLSNSASSVGTFTWTSSIPTVAAVSAGGVVTGISGGTSRITFTNVCGSNNRVVTVNATPTVNAIAGPGFVNVGATIALSDATPGGLWTSSNTAIGTVNTSGVVTGLNAGSTTITYIRTVNGCSNNATKNILVTNPLSAAISSTNVSCNGGNNGSAVVTASNGAGSYVYSWSPSGGTNATVTGLTAGTYTCAITDAASVVITETVTITEPEVLTSTSAQTNVSCNGGNNGTATVSVSGGTTPYSYSWSAGSTTASASGLAAGSYTCIITDANGCSITQAVSISEPAVLASTSSQTNVSCNGGNNGTATVSVNGGTTPYTYSWSTGATTASTSGLAAGSYTCTITDANGCSATQVTSISEPSMLTATSSQTNVSCNGGNNGTATVSVSGGTTPYNYSWSTGATTALASDLAAGSYTCTVTDANGCSITQAVSISEPAILTATSAQTNVSCNGDNNGAAAVSVSGGTTPYIYSWSTGSTTASASDLAAGSYTCTITDANGCSITQEVSISEPAILTATSAQTNVSCNGGNNGAAAVSVSGGTTPYTYSWSSGSTTASASSLAAGSYTCTIADANGCSTIQAVSISEPIILTATSSQTNVSCNGGNNGTATVSVSGGTTPYTYAWSTGATTASASGLAAGSYTCTITDANGCSTIQAVSISEPIILTATSTQSNVSCNGSNNGTATVSVSGGTTPYTYSWSTGATTALASGLAAGSYTCTIIDANGCSATEAVNVSEPTILTAISSQTNVSCNGGNNGAATVSASGGTTPYTYSWSNGAITASASGLTVGSYACTITDANGCTTVNTITITGPSAITLSAVAGTIACHGGATSLTISGAGGTGALTGVGTFTVAAGTYSYTVTDENGCTAATSGSVAEPATLVVTGSISGASCTSSLTTSVSGGTAGYTYLWNNGATTPGISGVEPGAYALTVTDAHGCTAAYASAISSAPRTVTVRLVTSTGAGIAGGAVQYYNGSWQSMGTTDANGYACMTFPTSAYASSFSTSFKVSYAGGAKQWNAIAVASSPILVASTTNVSLTLKDHTGTLITSESGTAGFYAGSWVTLGSTGAGGFVQKELLPGSYAVNMKFHDYTHQQTVVVTTGPTQIVDFTTTLVTLSLRRHTGALITSEDGTGGYYAGGWHTLGSTSGTAQVSVELLPGAGYTFNMNFHNYTQQQTAAVSGLTQSVDFTTTLVTLNLKDHSGALITSEDGTGGYYAGGWNTLGVTGGTGRVSVELLPGAGYTFNMNFHGYTQQQAVTVAGGGAWEQDVDFRTTLVSVNLKNCGGALINTGSATAGYYAGSWRSLGATAGGSAGVELLAGTGYFFNMSYNNGAQQIGPMSVTTGGGTYLQDADFNTTKVKFSNPNGSAISYYQSGWNTFMPDSMELLPGNYYFKVTSGGAAVSKSVSGCTKNFYIAPTGTLDIATVSNGGCGGSYTLIAPGGSGSYLWSNSATTQSTVANASGTYSVTVGYDFSSTGAVGGATTYTATVTVNPGTVTMRLIDSKGNPIAGGNVLYYNGSWLTFGSGTTDANGYACMSFPTPAFASTFSGSFRVSYSGGSKQWNGIAVASNPVLVAQTTDVVLNLKDHNGNLITAESGIGGYYAGSWLTAGSTGAIGSVRKELLPGSYSLNMKFHDYTQQQTVVVATGPTQNVDFTTTLVTLNLKDHTGELITSEDGTGGYYAGGWHTIGSTGGTAQVSLELLPGSGYTFNMNFHNYTQQQSLAVAAGPTQGIDFTTTLVTLALEDHTGALITTEDGTAGYYAGGWHTIGSTGGAGQTSLELLPGAGYTFSMAFHYGTQQQVVTVAGSTQTVHFRTALVNIHFQGNTGIAHAGATINYYTSGWHLLGATDASGNASIEMLPVPCIYNASLTGYGTTQVGPFTDAAAGTPTHIIQSGAAARQSSSLTTATTAAATVEFSVFPNPASVGVSIRFNSVKDGQASLKIADMAGKVIIDQVVKTTAGANVHQIEFNDMASGTYMLMFENGDNNEVRQVVVRH